MSSRPSMLMLLPLMARSNCRDLNVFNSVSLLLGYFPPPPPAAPFFVRVFCFVRRCHLLNFVSDFPRRLSSSFDAIVIHSSHA